MMESGTWVAWPSFLEAGTVVSSVAFGEEDRP